MSSPESEEVFTELRNLNIRDGEATKSSEVFEKKNSLSALEDLEAGAFSKIIEPASHTFEVIRTLHETRPEKQDEAVMALLDNEAALYERKRIMSPKELAEQGHIQYDLKVESVSDGAIASLKVVRLVASKDCAQNAASCESKRYLRKGVWVFILEQYENPTDAGKRNKEAKPKEYVKGMLSGVGPAHFDIVIDKDLERQLPKGAIQIEGSEALQVYWRMHQAIALYKIAETSKSEDLPFLANVVRGRVPVKISEAPVTSETHLNASQKRAMAYALGSELSVIKGPPGTGKTVVLYETIMELVRQGETVLISCGTHTAVDNLIERLDKHSDGFGIDRLGHPHRVSPSLRHLCVSVKSEQGTSATPPQIVAATLHAAWDISDYEPVNTIIIDEVCQALQAQCWIPIVSCKAARRLIIAGDDKQLPPVITIEDKETAKTLEISLFDVLLKCYGSKVMHLLDTQYRMSESIMRFSSDYMYGGLLVADAKVSNQKLHHVAGVNKSLATTASVLWIDTSSLGFTETSGRRGLIENPVEARIVKTHCLNLQRQGVKLNNIGVISPYNHQKNLIKDVLPAVEVNTVDGYQGQEKNVIVLSLVRSNAAAIVGFLADERRMNVALTRARYQLCVVGDMRTIDRCESPFLNAWVEWCTNHATVVKPNASGDFVSYEPDSSFKSAGRVPNSGYTRGRRRRKRSK